MYIDNLVGELNTSTLVTCLLWCSSKMRGGGAAIMLYKRDINILTSSSYLRKCIYRGNNGAYLYYHTRSQLGGRRSN